MFKTLGPAGASRRCCWRALCVLNRVLSSLLGPVDFSLRAFTGRLKLTVRRHKSHNDSFSWLGRRIPVLLASPLQGAAFKKNAFTIRSMTHLCSNFSFALQGHLAGAAGEPYTGRDPPAERGERVRERE